MESGWRSAKPRKKTQQEKRAEKKMRSSYFTQQYDAYGENFSNFKTPQDIRRESYKIFKALADETRLKIIDTIIEEPKTVGQIVETVEESQSGVSHQLKTLKESKIVKSQRKGKCVYYSLADDHVKKIVMETFLHATHGDEE